MNSGARIAKASIGMLPRSLRKRGQRFLADRWFIYEMLRDSRIAALENKVRSRTNGVVQSGPFAGMALVSGASWGDGSSKLLGLYESELFPAISSVVDWAPDLVVNVGCAEGYYAVGLAMLVPEATVIAFDTMVAAQEICRKNAEVNGVSDRIVVRGECDASNLGKVIEDASKPFVFLDCEGAERDILAQASMDEMKKAAILVECHDIVDRTITESIINKYSDTHEIQRIDQAARNPYTSPIIHDLTEDDRWLLVSERRPEPMHWLLLAPRQAKQDRRSPAQI